LDRPFTDPRLVGPDRAILIGMIRDLHSRRTAPQQINRPKQGRDRFIVTDAGRSHGKSPVAIVGFFGQRREDGSSLVADEIEEINSTMLANFSSFPPLLGYVSRLLADGFNYANLVVLTSSDAIRLWRERSDHVPAAADLSPLYYSSVRIYNGAIPCGLGCWEHLRLDVVKYWDYSDHPVWRATRSIRQRSEPGPNH
jgi:hypothetical protein